MTFEMTYRALSNLINLVRFNETALEQRLCSLFVHQKQ